MPRRRRADLHVTTPGTHLTGALEANRTHPTGDHPAADRRSVAGLRVASGFFLQWRKGCACHWRNLFLRMKTPYGRIWSLTCLGTWCLAISLSAAEPKVGDPDVPEPFDANLAGALLEHPPFT